MKVAYICDRKACGESCSSLCFHTTDVTHAKNFKHFGGNHYVESDSENPIDILEEKKKVIENLKRYKKTRSKTTISEELDLHAQAYTFIDILRIVMDGPYCASTGEIIQRLIDLLEA